MAEWSIAAVLKTVEGHTSGGSNPSLSAIKPDYQAFVVHTPNFAPKIAKLGVFYVFLTLLTPQGARRCCSTGGRQPKFLHVQTGHTIFLTSPCAHRKNPLTPKSHNGNQLCNRIQIGATQLYTHPNFFFCPAIYNRFRFSRAYIKPELNLNHVMAFINNSKR